MSEEKKSNSNFLVQGSILAIASIISRIIGLIYRVPLQNIIGDVGIDYYSCAYDIYSILLLISSYSLPLAVSKLVSARVAKGQRKNASRIFKGALCFALITGTIAGLIVYFGAEYITANLMNTPYSYFALRVLGPGLLVVAILGVLRGYFQGLGTMVPSAISQVIEQIVNAVVSVVAAYTLFKRGSIIGAVLGDEENYGAAYGAAGGTLGTLSGSVVALLFIVLLYLAYQRIHKRQLKRDHSKKQESYRQIAALLFFTIVPVLLSTTIYNISSILDQGIFKQIVNMQGYSASDISIWWGKFSGKYKLLINVPIAIASALSASSVPALSGSYAKGETQTIKRQINSATRFSMLLAFPCAVGLTVLAGPILQLLFQDTSDIAIRMMVVGSSAVVFYSLSTISNGILQGINKLNLPVRNAVIALVLHIVFLVVLLFGFDMNIYAVVYANMFYALLMCVLNQLSIQKYTTYRIDFIGSFIKPGLASAGMGFFVWGSYKLVHILFGNTISTVVAICVGIFTYFILLLLLKGITETELRRLPKGELLVRMGRNLHLL